MINTLQPDPDRINDRLYAMDPAEVRLEGPLADIIRLCIDQHLKVLDYRWLVDWFRQRPNPFAVGELWGKTVRSACPLIATTGDGELRALIARSVDDLLSTQDADGCISTRSRDQQPLGSDLWERKYVILGLLAWHRLTRDQRVLDAMVQMADHTLSQVGPPPKRHIVETGWAFAGIESSSILEPMLQLYRLTGNPLYADQVECSLHNALLGALIPSGDAWDYFQNLRGRRGGTQNFFEDVSGFTLSCCTANGPMGLAILPGMAVMASADGGDVSCNNAFPDRQPFTIRPQAAWPSILACKT